MATNRYFYATGKRKTAIAKARLEPGGKGDMKINEKEAAVYLTTKAQFQAVYAPLKATGMDKTFAISILVRGGGPMSQAEAIRHALSRALIESDPSLRTTLKKLGYLTRDSRVKERKKPGLHRARRGPQWAKR